MQSRLTVFLLTFSILTALMLPISAALPTAQDFAIYDGIIRLHVIANSDSESDQQLKLYVRDGILSTVSELLENTTDRAEAERLISENLDTLKASAEYVLTDHGSDYSVSVTLTKEHYPTREYSNISLPAGTYTSLRVLIGEAGGKNWWCVLFPTMCVGAVSDIPAYAAVDESELIAAGLTPSQVRIITGDSPEVTVKFRILEFIGSIFS